MVLWSELTESIAKNQERGFCVPVLQPRSEVDVERFPILRTAIAASIAIPLIPTVIPTVIPTAVIAVIADATTIIIPKIVTANTDNEEDIESIEPPPPPQKQLSPINAITLSAQPIVKRTKELHTLKREIDPIVIGIDQKDPLYDDAPHRTKHQMECEEAQRLEGMLNDLYKTQGGRSRGWTKTGLESMMKPRCASGGDIKELDRAKKAFLWQLVVEDKPCSAFLDFVCLAKKIRVAVWFLESKQVVLYPAADNLDDGDEFPLYNVTSQGLPRIGIRNCAELVTYCDSNSFILMPPNSIVHSLSTLNMGELESVGKKLGMATVEGSKAERVAKVAIYKLRLRLA